MTAALSHTFDFGGEAINFSIERTARRKTVAISVGYDGVRALAPADLDDHQVIGIVRKKGPWISANRLATRNWGEHHLFGSSLVARHFIIWAGLIGLARISHKG